MPAPYLSIEAMAAWIALDRENNGASKEWWDWAVSAYGVAAQQEAEADVAVGSHLKRVLEDDEIVGEGGSFHMERMDDDHIWFQVDSIAFDLDVKRGKLLWRPQCNGGWPALALLLGHAA
ncbi:MAG: hypothetical protein WC935_00135 [Thermoleophilia bacterium]